MKRLIVAFVVLCSVLGWASLTEAAVPGKKFTETNCEGYSDSVARLYSAGLGRETDEAGFRYWMNEYTSGRVGFGDMAYNFVNSTEFKADNGAVENRPFVELMYLNVLGREGELAGVDYWTGLMNGGTAQATVLMNFAESPENIARTGTAAPTLGDFNTGLNRAWTCPGWSSGEPQDLPAGSCSVLGRNIIDTPEVRLSITNTTGNDATASVSMGGKIDGVRVDDQFVTVRLVRPGQTVEHDSILIGDVFDGVDIARITCSQIKVTWRADPITPLPTACTVTGLNIIGTPTLRLQVTNPLGSQADASIVLLATLDGVRVDDQFISVRNVLANETVQHDSILLSDRLEDIDISRIGCEAVNQKWDPTT